MSEQFWFDPASNVMVYPGAIAPHVAPFLDGLKQADQFFAVPRTLRNLQVLRHYNYPVMPLVTRENYDFPAAPGIKPYDSQVLATNFMLLHPRSFNLSDMGSGKTNSALWASDWLMKHNAPGTCRALVVAPLSILQSKWGGDIFRNMPGRTFQILHGDASKRMAALDKPADYYLVNFDGVGVGAHTRKKFELDGFSKALAERKDIRIAIIDEASAYKDSTTKRHRIARAVFGQKEYLWLMSGSPTPNAPTDAYGLAKLVNNAFGKSFGYFQLETMRKITQFKWIPQADGYEKAARLLSPSIRIDIRQVWDAPEMVTMRREVPLTDEQTKLLASLKKELQVVIKEGTPITAANEAAARTKFVQIVLGAVYDSNHKVHTVDARPRVNELKSVLEQASGKSIIFAPLTSVVHNLYHLLKKDYSCAMVNGEVPQKERAKIFADFQNAEDPRIIIADPGTMSHGLDLFAARSVIWYGITEKSELYSQANKRAHRPGQKYPVAVVQITATKLETEIFHRLENNLTLQGTLLDMIKKGEF